MEVVLRLRMPDTWVDAVCRDLPAPIKFVECKPHGDAGGHGLVEIHAEEASVEAIIRAIAEHPSVHSAEFSPLRSGGVLGSIVTSRCAACQELSGSECFLTAASTLDDGRVEWRLITGGDGSLIDLLERLESRGCEIEVRSTRRLDRRSPLTPRQEEVIRMAFDMGYYEYPKRATIRDLARAFDVSPSTVAETLQRAEMKVIRAYLRENG